MVSREDLYNYLEFDPEAQAGYLLNLIERGSTNIDFTRQYFKTYEDVLSASFTWANSPEGFDYWFNIKQVLHIKKIEKK